MTMCTVNEATVTSHTVKGQFRISQQISKILSENPGCCSFAITISGPRWHRRPTHTVRSVWLPQFLRVWTNNTEQTFTGSAKHGHYEQFKHRLKGWIFECAYGRRRLIDIN